MTTRWSVASSASRCASVSGAGSRLAPNISFFQSAFCTWEESLDGFARSLADLCDNLTWLHRLGIRFITLHERLDLDPKTGAGQKFLDHLEILAKAESRMIVRNVRAGVARAKSLGVHCGRPLRRFPRAQACKLRREGLSISAIAARLGVPASTVADALRPPAQKPS